jgi:hypothetical protein
MFSSSMADVPARRALPRLIQLPGIRRSNTSPVRRVPKAEK